jgi:hypothetical protein
VLVVLVEQTVAILATETLLLVAEGVVKALSLLAAVAAVLAVTTQVVLQIIGVFLVVLAVFQQLLEMEI